MVKTKYAKIYSKNDIGQTQFDGEAILLNKMDCTHSAGFWEYKFIEDMSTTHCGWINNSDIRQEE